MVVKSRPAAPPKLDLAYLGYFLGLRVNQLVMERMDAAGFQDVRESHGFVIQHLIERERSITELAQRMDVTQQAASKAVSELAELGVVDIAPSADRRAKKVRLSLRGWKVIRLGRQARRQIEGQLIRALGAEPYETARSVLSAALEALGGLEQVQSRRVLPPR